MKKIQIKWLKTYNVIICAVLGALGLTVLSCGVTYGTPSADFIIQGKVTDSQNNQPVKDIQVTVSWLEVSTDAEGKYKVVINDDFPESKIFPIHFKDIDGDLNGAYVDLDTIVEFKAPKFTDGDKHWYKGKTTKEFNVQLNPKE